MRGRLVVAAVLALLGSGVLPGASRGAGPTCAIADQVAPEGDSGVRMIEFNAFCYGPLEQTLVYSIKTADGTAVQGADYQAVDRSVAASAGDSVLSFAVPILGDTLHEGDETFTVTLADASGTVAFSRATATITILDNEEPAPVCTIPDSSFPEGDSGTKLQQIQITCDRRLPEDLSFHIRTADGTATAGVDYAPIDGDGSVVAGQTTINAAVQIVGDRRDEPDETFTYTITDNAGLVTFNTGTITILDDDEPAPASCILLSETAATVSGTASTPTKRRFASPDRLTVTNCGEGPVQLNARGTDAIGDGATWQLTDASSSGPIGSTCDLGINVFRLDVTLWLAGGGGLGTPLTTQETPLLGADGATPFTLPAAATQELSPQIELPCEGSDNTGDPMTTTVALTAVAP